MQSGTWCLATTTCVFACSFYSIKLPSVTTCYISRDVRDASREEPGDVWRTFLKINLRVWSNLKDSYSRSRNLKDNSRRDFKPPIRESKQQRRKSPFASRRFYPGVSSGCAPWKTASTRFFTSKDPSSRTHARSLKFLQARTLSMDLTYVCVHVPSSTEAAGVRALIDLTCNNTYDLDS